MTRRKRQPASVEQRLADLEQGFRVLSSALVTAYSSIASAKHGLTELAGDGGEVAILTTAGPLRVRLEADRE